MQETYFKIDDEYMFIRHNNIMPGKKSLLFVHGLGDSGLSFEDVFRYDRFNDFNIVVPDLIGYGRSSQCSKDNGYSFDSHLARFKKLIEEKELNDLIIIGHSMGGDLTTLMCQSDEDDMIKKYVNIEGDVTQHDLFISGDAVKAHENNRFEEWFENDFMNKKIYEDYGEFRSARKYYASLSFCRHDAFLENSIELLKRNNSLTGKYKSEIGRIYCSLSIPRVFCYGTLSLSKETLSFLKENNMQVKAFEDTGHSPMVDKADEFYAFLHDYISS